MKTGFLRSENTFFMLQIFAVLNDDTVSVSTCASIMNMCACDGGGDFIHFLRSFSYIQPYIYKCSEAVFFVTVEDY
jgi:hypothetical protein